MLLLIFLLIISANAFHYSDNECDCNICNCTTCSTECVCSKMSMPYDQYGKYCGVYYTGCPSQVPCDALDYCCAWHDWCVGCPPTCGHGYTSCLCNIGLINCIANISSEFDFTKLLSNIVVTCDEQYIAAGNIMYDICHVITYAPIGYGGCNKTDIPKICSKYLNSEYGFEYKKIMTP